MSSKSAVTYNGKAQKPAVTVYAGNRKISGKYYTVFYKNNTAVGTAMSAPDYDDWDLNGDLRLLMKYANRNLERAL